MSFYLKYKTDHRLAGHFVETTNPRNFVRVQYVATDISSARHTIDYPDKETALLYWAYSTKNPLNRR